MTKFHSDDYINFLKRITPDNVTEYSKQAQRCIFFSSPFHFFMVQRKKKKQKQKKVNVGDDCPVFDGLYEFCQISAGGSIGNFFFLSIYLSIYLFVN